MTNPAVIQIGDNTHHHDHAMTLQSLRVMNTMVRRPAKPAPLDVLLFVLLMVAENSKDAQQDAHANPCPSAVSWRGGVEGGQGWHSLAFAEEPERGSQRPFLTTTQ